MSFTSPFEVVFVPFFFKATIASSHPHLSVQPSTGMHLIDRNTSVPHPESCLMRAHSGSSLSGYLSYPLLLFKVVAGIKFMRIKPYAIISYFITRVRIYVVLMWCLEELNLINRIF